MTKENDNCNITFWNNDNHYKVPPWRKKANINKFFVNQKIVTDFVDIAVATCKLSNLKISPVKRAGSNKVIKMKPTSTISILKQEYYDY